MHDEPSFSLAARSSKLLFLDESIAFHSSLSIVTVTSLSFTSFDDSVEAWYHSLSEVTLRKSSANHTFCKLNIILVRGPITDSAKLSLLHSAKCLTSNQTPPYYENIAEKFWFNLYKLQLTGFHEVLGQLKPLLPFYWICDIYGCTLVTVFSQAAFALLLADALELQHKSLNFLAIVFSAFPIVSRVILFKSKWEPVAFLIPHLFQFSFQFYHLFRSHFCVCDGHHISIGWNTVIWCCIR